jgi:hypothetical protein
MTMDDAPKSAYEIALEKLKRQDLERGDESPARLTDEQKKRIAGIRQTYEARLAEREILFKSERAKAAAPTDAEALQKVEEEYARERAKLEERREREIAAVHASAGPQSGGRGRRPRTPPT